MNSLLNIIYLFPICYRSIIYIISKQESVFRFSAKGKINLILFNRIYKAFIMYQPLPESFMYITIQLIFIITSYELLLFLIHEK